MMEKKFSIITVTWNNAEGLKRTLGSIRGLRYKNREVIVVDGASMDNTKAVMEANNDIIDVCISEKDNGIYNAMNKGIRYATGDYTVFMNAGDCFASADVLDIVAQHDEALILGSAKYGDDVRIIPSSMSLYDVLTIGINHQSTYYRTDVLQRYGFDENLRVIADLKSVVEPLAKEKVSLCCITDILSVCEGGGLSKQRWMDMLDEKKRIVRDVIEPFYREDYARFSRINNSMIGDFIILSHFTSIFPLVRLLSKVCLFINRHFKHIPL